MKRLIVLGLALAAGMFSTASRADVDVHIGIGVPGVVIDSHPRHHHYHPPVRHRHYAPPVYYYPEKVYKRSHKHHKHKHYKHRHQSRQHLHRGHRPGPPPHAYARGHWSR